MNKKEELIKKLNKQLVISCQALPGEPLYFEEMTLMPFMAKASELAGASGIRANGIRDIKAIKEVVDLPIIGLIKKQYIGGEQYITVGMNEIDELVKVGVDIIALDCTLRPRYDKLHINEFIKQVKDKYPNILLMADISNFEEAKNVEKQGVDFIGTTLNGYTSYTKTSNEPNFELVEQMVKELKTPIIAEGRIHTPEQAKKMLDLGVLCVIVGGAITRPLEIAKRFIEGMGIKN